MSNTLNIKDLKDVISGAVAKVDTEAKELKNVIGTVVAKVESNVNGLNTVISDSIVKIEERMKALEAKETKWEETEKQMQAHADTAAQKVVLDIGGKRFAASKAVLLSVEGTFFHAMLSSGRWLPGDDGSYFIDRNPKLFPVILDYLRSHTVAAKRYGYDSMGDCIKDLNVELDFYQIKIPLEIFCREFEETTILDSSQKYKLWSWIRYKRTTLIYVATRDGFAAANFHKQCDNKGSTLTIVRSNQNYLFGGYTDHLWDSSNTGKNGASWIFTLTNPANVPQQYFIASSNSTGIYTHTSYGPSFGSASDICVANSSNSNSSSYCNFPNCFKDTTGRGQATFTGAYNFQTNEIEVYLIQ